jgi:peptidoglycan/LPS O-acetylase OafA/YrhL
MATGTDSRPRIEVLNGFRACAILGIVLFHLLHFANPAFEYGHAVWMPLAGALDTFFIIAGCVLFLPVVRRGSLGGLPRFARKRFARLIPAYWLTLTLILVIIAATGGAFPGPAEIAVQYAALQAPAHLIDATLPVGFGVDQPLWLISVIIGLYALLALAWRPYLRHPLVGLALAAAITTAWTLAAVHMTAVFGAIEGHAIPSSAMEAIVNRQLPGWLFSFALGMTCAWAYVRLAEPQPRERLERLAIRAAPLAVASYVVCAYLYAELAMDAGGAAGGAASRTSPLLVLAFTFARAAVIAVVVLGPALWARPFAGRVARELTELSYGLYLIHYVVAVYVGERLLDLPKDGTLGTIALWIAVVIPPSFAFAYLSLRFVERPARKWAARPRDAEGRRRARVSPEPLGSRPLSP